MHNKQNSFDVIIIGASASGLMCAIEAGKRGKRVLVLDHANKAGKKILMSGGGRCNFTNLEVTAQHYLSHNPHYCKSALSRYTQWDFIAKVLEYNIPYHERDLGKLFCDDSAKDILNMLLAECTKAKVTIRLKTTVLTTDKKLTDQFEVKTNQGEFYAVSLVVASGGLSIPKMCASPIGYKIAEYYGHNLKPTYPGLVPFTLHEQDKQTLEGLSGIAIECEVKNKRASFTENVLFTHRGLSGPAILQISSYWRAGEEVSIDLLPSLNVAEYLAEQQNISAKKHLKNCLAEYLPKRLVEAFIDDSLLDQSLQELSKSTLNEVGQQFNHWQLKPNATEGYRTRIFHTHRVSNILH